MLKKNKINKSDINDIFIKDIDCNDSVMNYRKNMFAYNNIVLINGEALEEMSNIKDSSIDCIVCDLPYGTTKNVWDSVIDLEKLWFQFNRIIKDGGNIVLTASQPFTSKLISSNFEQFKYEIIWVKTIGSGQLNINIMPLKKHESILIFRKGKGKGTYNEQLDKGNPYKIKRNIKSADCYNRQKAHELVNSGTRRATSVLEVEDDTKQIIQMSSEDTVWVVPNPRIKNGHPTQKPLALLQRIIRTYSNEGDVILDCTFGSGSTGKACQLENRKFIGIEMDTKYYEGAVEWISGNQSN
ncbi:site-specific DNA-methyltransferase [Clostridium perfringens]|nr:site-specific DNA-methyltransferase [Clostridium perfringens]MDU2323406.1 site-specific DNA-methyltransferase [Clostridium perfringens]